MNKLRECRIKKGVSMEATANSIGISKQRFNYMEKIGGKTRLAEDTIRKLAEVLGVNPFYMMGDEWLDIIPRTQEEFVDAVESLREAYERNAKDA